MLAQSQCRPAFSARISINSQPRHEESTNYASPSFRGAAACVCDVTLAGPPNLPSSQVPVMPSSLVNHSILEFFFWAERGGREEDAHIGDSAVLCCPVLGCGACVPAHVFEGAGHAHAYYRVGEAIARPSCTACRLHSLCIRSCLVWGSVRSQLIHMRVRSRSIH